MNTFMVLYVLFIIPVLLPFITFEIPLAATNNFNIQISLKDSEQQFPQHAIKTLNTREKMSAPFYSVVVVDSKKNC